ncbi:MAG: transketolase [Christensenellaceae bacterium]|nr:transketolase [Christensenellaceae bacterium]MEA5065916.1 transketolase [Eubacteriales bacterium]MEA5067585.1 transketolase [Christensenellaceae bacterium]
MILAARARMLALDAVHEAQSGHVGGSLSALDILTVLYWNVLNIDPADGKNPDRDRFVMSKGHCSPALYAALALRGYFDPEELKHFRNVNHHLSGHVEMRYVPGVDMSAGSLGQGLSAGAGMALTAKIDRRPYRTFVMMGDGEVAEGQIWEAAMCAAHYKLDNLVGIVDVNGLQIDGATCDVMNSAPLDEKFRAFGWHVLSVNGHDHAALNAAFRFAETLKGKPVMLLCETVKGKGVSFMENVAGWHGKAPNDEQFERAMRELQTQLNGLEA